MRWVGGGLKYLLIAVLALVLIVLTIGIAGNMVVGVVGGILALPLYAVALLGATGGVGLIGLLWWLSERRKA